MSPAFSHLEYAELAVLVSCLSQDRLCAVQVFRSGFQRPMSALRPSVRGAAQGGV